jgi:hypothetical protein
MSKKEQRPTKDEHFVPVFYLSNFLKPNGMLQAYNVQTGKFFTPRPKDICREKYIYESPKVRNPREDEDFIAVNSIEKEFSANENKYKQLVAKIVSVCSIPANIDALVCNAEEKDLLADFVANMFVRSKWMLDKNRATFVNLCSEFFKDDNDWKLFCDRYADGNVMALTDAIAMRNLLSTKNENSLHTCVKNIIRKMFPTFCYSPHCNFITSDFPILLHSDRIDNKNFLKCLYLPIHPRCAVMLCCYKPNNHKNRIKYFTKEETADFNSMYLDSMDDTVHQLYATDIDDIEKILKNKNKKQVQEKK